MVDAIYETIDDQNGEILFGKSSGFSSVNHTLRLYEENGLYVSDGLNPLSHTVPLFEPASQYNYIPEYYARDY